MQSSSAREASQACFQVCCATPLSLTESKHPKPTNSAATSRANFAKTTASFFPNALFTNHESLPSLSEAFYMFTKIYPEYSETKECDHIRAHEYYHFTLSNRVCLDYSGFGLFSGSQRHALMPSSSAHSDAPSDAQFSFFDVSYRSASLSSQVHYGCEETPIESALRKRIMSFLNIAESEYGMVCTANGASAFKLLAESYGFPTNRKLLTVCDYRSDAVSAMIESSQKRGAKVMSANFSWPGLTIHSTKLRKMVVSRRKKRKNGLFVFPLQSRITGRRYSYQWMNLAQENGWHVLLDACALGAKDLDTLGLSLFRPDFLICSFYKAFGEDPSGLGCLFVKRTSSSVLETSTMARSIGIVSILPAKAMKCSFSCPTSGQTSNDKSTTSTSSDHRYGKASELCEMEIDDAQKGSLSSEIVELESANPVKNEKNESNVREINEDVIESRGLDHADALGLPLISSRVRCLINWLVNALMKLQHPHSENGSPLIRIYGPKVKFDRGPAVAFNVFDWKGEKVEPVLVQKLADRNNISLSYAFLENIWFSDKYEEDKVRFLEARKAEVALPGSKGKEKVATGIIVVTVSIGFLTNFEDIYRLWAFIAKFLDADFVEKERWRYTALNQKTIEV